MKKILGFVVTSLLAVLPFAVDAATSIDADCGDVDEAGNILCSVNYKITETEIADYLNVTITEEGGAQIVDISGISGSDWSLSTSENGNVWSVFLTSPGVAGEGQLFTFAYTPSGEEDCLVSIDLDGKKIEIIPDDTPTEEVETGSTLPYIALGILALGSVGAYVATKNKSKMYRI